MLVSLSVVWGKLLQLASGNPDVAPDVFEKAFRRGVSHYLLGRNAAAATGTNAIAETGICCVKQKSRLVRVLLVPDAAVTANGTNYWSLIVRKRTAALPGTQVALTTFPVDTPTTDDLVAWAARDVLGTGATLGAATAFDFAENDIATYEVTKTGGSGLSFPAASLYLEFEPRD